MRQTRPLPDTHPEFTVFHWPGFTEYRVEHWRLARDGSGRVVRGTCIWSWVDAGALALVLVVASVLFLTRVRGEGIQRQGCSARVPVPIAVLDPCLLSSRALITGIGVALTYLIWARCTQVLHESLLVFPTLGIQLETHRGHPLFPHGPLSTTHHFIPLAALQDVVLHEGFRRWDVRYYLAALYRTRTRTWGTAEVDVPEVPATIVGDDDHDAAPGPGPDTLGGVVEVRVAFENILPHFPILKEVYLGVQQTLFPPPTRIVETSKAVTDE